MNKQKDIEKLNTFKFRKKTIELFKEQITCFYENKNLVLQKNDSYNVGDEVLLDSNTLIHGSRICIDELETISKNGLIAPEFFKEYNKNKKKPFVVEFWRIDEQISLKNFIDKYCGVCIEVKNNDGSLKDKIMTPVNNIEKELLQLENYRDYIIYQNQEQRFLPNKYNKYSTLAFIMKNNNQTNQLIKNDIFSKEFNSKILKDILPKWFIKKYINTGAYDNYETGRERAIIYGVPSSFIEGIMVCEKYEKDEEILKTIKKLFPNCYICNLDGKVIRK